MDLTELAPEQCTRLQGTVNELVVKIAHPDYRLEEGCEVRCFEQGAHPQSV
jgi:hypothetical protein